MKANLLSASVKAADEEAGRNISVENVPVCFRKEGEQNSCCLTSCKAVLRGYFCKVVSEKGLLWLRNL